MTEHGTDGFAGSQYSMAERLFLLCWDADRGRVSTPCSTSLAPALGGALVIDAIESGAISTSDGAVILGIFPSTSYPVVDTATQEAIRASVHDLATGQRDPAAAHPDEVMLTAMAGPSEALSLLIADRRVRRDAKKRAEDLANGEGIPPAVSKAIAEAQAAMIAAFTAISAATAASSSSSSSSS